MGDRSAIPTYGSRFANYRAFAAGPPRFILEVARRGPIVRVPFFHTSFVVLNECEGVEEVVVRQHASLEKDVTSHRLREFLGHGLLTGEGEHWKRQRRLIQPAFHRRRIAGYADVMVRLAEASMPAWGSAEARDVHADLAGLTLEIVGETLFGADVRGATEAVGEALELTMGRYAGEHYGGLLPLWVPTRHNRRIVAAIRRVDAVIQGIIGERRASGAETDDLLSMLLHAQDEDGSRMSDAQLRDECLTLFLAGHETTALATSYALFLLACHPEIQEEVAAELDAVLGARTPTIDDVSRLHATTRALKEGMRLYPPAWSIGRQAMRPVHVGGHDLPAGTQFAIFQYGLHRDPRHFPEPERFLPGRWTEDFERSLPKLAYMPFGAGPRICIGNTFAMVEGVLLLACLLRRFHVELAQAPHLDLLFSITLRPSAGVRVRLRPRKPAAAELARAG